MAATNTSVRTTLRIPGAWSHPRELQERLPTGFRLTPETLLLPDGAEVEFCPMQPDDEFAEIFRSSCRQPASDEELAVVGGYTVNIGLTGPGGSLASALTTMRAGAAIVRAGGAGVFIDNAALAHGGGHWIELADDGSPDALSFAFVSIAADNHELWTMGMHVLGFPEIIMPRLDLPPDTVADPIIDVIRYVCHTDKPIGDGHLLGDEFGPRFQAAAAPDDKWNDNSPMHNPFGRLRLTSIRDVSQDN